MIFQYIAYLIVIELSGPVLRDGRYDLGEADCSRSQPLLQLKPLGLRKRQAIAPPVGVPAMALSTCTTSSVGSIVTCDNRRFCSQASLVLPKARSNCIRSTKVSDVRCRLTKRSQQCCQ